MAVTSPPVRRPGRGPGWDLAGWYLVRLSGLALFPLALAHFAITQFVYDPSVETAAWIVRERWASVAWRTIDLLMLSLLLIHGVLGVRTVIHDHVGGLARTIVLAGIYVLGFSLFVLAAGVVMTIPFPVR